MIRPIAVNHIPQLSSEIPAISTSWLSTVDGFIIVQLLKKRQDKNKIIISKIIQNK